MIKRVFCSLCVLLLTCASFAQVAVDIFDPFYKSLTDWENKNLVSDVPELWPLPLQEIERILDYVKEYGNERDKTVAEEHYQRIFGRIAHVGGVVDLGFGFGGLDTKYLHFAPLLELNYVLSKYVSVSLQVLPDFANKLPSQEPLPLYTNSKRDVVDDDSDVGSLKLLQHVNSGLTIGTSEYYFSVNFSRASYSPFRHSGIFLSSDALHQGQFTFVMNKPILTYTHSLFILSATDDFGQKHSPNKYMSFHSFQFKPLSWLSFTLLESIVYGDRFEPIYLIPLSFFFQSQGLFGFPDNSLIGINFSVRPIDGLRLDGAVYFDDMGFNDMIQFKKDYKARISGQFGASYTMPESHWFKSVALDYTFVTPYMYTHVANAQDSTLNHQNYTHYGKNIGTNLDPNSDRVYFKVEFEPVKAIEISLSNTFIRHGNINESVTSPPFLVNYMNEGSGYNTDGTIFNHATIWVSKESRRDLFQHENPFLKQPTINYINQLSLDISCHLPIKRSGGHMKFFFGYCFEVDINPGVRNPIFHKSAVSESWGNPDFNAINSGSFSNGSTTFTSADILNEAKAQIAEWQSKAKGKNFNHYIKLGANVAY